MTIFHAIVAKIVKAVRYSLADSAASGCFWGVRAVRYYSHQPKVFVLWAVSGCFFFKLFLLEQGQEGYVFPLIQY